MRMSDYDRFVTSEPPSDGFEEWYDVMNEAFSDEFFEANELWIAAYGGIAEKWMHKLFYSVGAEPEYAAKLIERAFNIYNKD